MRHYLFLAASAALVLASCTNEVDFSQESLQAQNETQTAVQFGTYLGKTGTTRAAAAEGDIVAPNAASGNKLGTAGYEFGVFAYYTQELTYGQQQHGTYTAESGSASNIAPNFMYNQKVSFANEGATWTYAPIKYWPNEFANGDVDTNTPAAQGAASNGNVSFFAYAPYTDGTSLGSDGITAISSATTTGDPTITYTIPTDINTGGAFVDLLWGTLSGTGQNVLSSGNIGVTGDKDATANTYEQAVLDGKTVNADLNKQKVSGKVGFNFLHALAKIGGGASTSSTPTAGFLVQLDIDNGATISGGSRETFDAGSGFTDAWRTIVTIKSITITNDLDNSGGINDSEVGLGGSKVLNLATGQWSSASSATTFTQTIGTADGTNTYNAVLNTKLAEIYDNTPTTWLEHLGSSDVKNYFKYTSTEDITDVHPGVMETAQSVYNAETQSPFILFPGTIPSFKITVDYIVRTYDAALDRNYTEVEQTISKTITFGAPVEMNKHYSLLMHLGLTGVKFTASVSNWETGYMFDTNGDSTPDSNEIALPINVSD